MFFPIQKIIIAFHPYQGIGYEQTSSNYLISSHLGEVTPRVSVCVHFTCLGASVVYVNNLRWAIDLVLCFPYRTSVCTNDLISVHGSIKPN